MRVLIVVAVMGALLDGGCAIVTDLSTLREGPDGSTPDGGNKDASSDDTSVLPNDAGAGFDVETCANAAANVLYLAGTPNEYIHAGVATITQGQWSLKTSSPPIQTLTVDLVPTNPADGISWKTTFSSGGPALAVQNYANASRYTVDNAGSPRMDVSGNGKGCNAIAGDFEIEQLVIVDGGVKSVTVTFDQICDGENAKLVGCVHVQQ